MSGQKLTAGNNGRLYLVAALLLCAMAALLARMVFLNLYDRDFLQGQGDARYLRVVSMPAHRGMLTDRNGEPLAISTPVKSVWANPSELASARERWPQLAQKLDIPLERLERTLGQRMEREFVYLRRRLSPEQAEAVMDLRIPGISLQQEYRRYYPTGEVAAHLIGFTDVDDHGLEGLELMLDDYLTGSNGSKRVIKDRLGRVIEDVESIAEPQPGENIRLSIDRRLQYLAYRELKSAVQRNRARSGSLVVLDAQTGEVLAMVNQPAYNPNNRHDRKGSRYRNRAVTDPFEPGSTMKPFTMAAALESGQYRPDSRIDTSPGLFRLAGFTIRDHRNYGVIDMPTVIQKSSNVGASRIALSLEPEQLWETFTHVGFGIDTGSGYPGEAVGLLNPFQQWRKVEWATLSYGYGMSSTVLQLAHAYTVLASGGVNRPVSFLRLEPDEIPRGERVLSEETTQQVLRMMELVTQRGGTATTAAIPGYRVAGKTGTVHKASAGGYDSDQYHSLFAGIVPASRPRLVMVALIDQPQGEDYYGGLVAAPVFANVMNDALRLLNIAPDDLESLQLKVAATGHGGEQ